METLPCRNFNRPLCDRCSGNHWQAAVTLRPITHASSQLGLRCFCTAISTMTCTVLAICHLRSDKYLQLSNVFSMFPFTNTGLPGRPHLRLYLSNGIIICWRIKNGLFQACLCKDLAQSSPSMKWLLSGSELGTWERKWTFISHWGSVHKFQLGKWGPPGLKELLLSAS